MKNLNKANIEKILENEIKYAKSWNYEIKIEIIIELNMLNINITSYNNTITINIINKFTKTIKKKLKMQIILIKSINNGIIIYYIHQLKFFTSIFNRVY